MDERYPSATTLPDRRNAGDNHKPELNRAAERGGSPTGQGRTPLNDVASHASEAAGEVIEHAKTAATQVVDHAAEAAGETVAAVATDLAKRAPEMARSVREQAGAAYAQGTEYVSRNVRTYPLMTLFIAGAVGYGLGYIMSSRQ